jgi:NADPH-dependent glutamate synthase beta subunit-like oxidoreductase
MAMKSAGRSPLDEVGQLHRQGVIKEAEVQREEEEGNLPIMTTTKISNLDLAHERYLPMGLCANGTSGKNGRPMNSVVPHLGRVKAPLPAEIETTEDGETVGLIGVKTEDEGGKGKKLDQH